MTSSPQPTTYLSTVLNPHSPPPRASFSATQRSLQARHKDANVTAGSRKARDAESYENRQKREEAATVLDSTEMLIWWSGVRNESIPQTRRHFQDIVRGVQEEGGAVVWCEEWEVQDGGIGGVAASPMGAKGKEKEGGKGKRRVVSAGM